MPEEQGQLRRRVVDLVMTRFVKQAAEPGAQEHVAEAVDEKLGRIAQRKDESTANLRKLLEQARIVWANRAQLSRQHLLLVAAALLYFISPLDAVPDFIPVVGYADDVLALAWVLKTVFPLLKTTVGKVVDDWGDASKDPLVGKSQPWSPQKFVDNWVDDRIGRAVDRFSASANDAVNRSIMAVAVSLWGATTAAGLSLAVRAIAGSYPDEWVAYVSTSAVLVVVWNSIVALDWWRRYKSLDGKWQERVRKLATSQLRARHVVMIGVPVLALFALGVVRIVAYSAP